MDDNIQLKLGDCLDLLHDVADESIDMVMTSPPYDNLRTYGISENIFPFEKFASIADELARVLKPGGVIVWVVNDATIDGSESLTSFKQAIYFKDNCGLNVHDTMIWEKDTFSFPDAKRYAQAFEYMFVFSKGIPKTVHKLRDRKNKWANSVVHGTSRGKDGTTFRKSNDKKSTVSDVGERFNVWQLPGEKQNTFDHPAVYPLRLCKDHIFSWSDEGDLILDPFMGSGTTGVACKLMHRRFIGFELNPDFYSTAENRISTTVAQNKLFSIADNDSQ